jgi:chloride channel protein, CIC family
MRSPFHWVPEFLTFLGKHRARAQIRVLGAAIAVGLVAGIGAIIFYVATAVVAHYALGEVVGYRPEPHPNGEPALPWLTGGASSFRPWPLLIVPTAGGLASGLIVFAFAPEAEGHGTDAVIAAYHHHEGRIRPRVPIVKLLASALTLGSGGSGGREGPIAQIGAGFGSLLATLLHLRPADRRVLCVAGMGAGIAAIFRAPLAGALFAAEVLYWSPEFEPEAIIPAGIASVVSYCTFGAVFGWRPLFSTPELTFDDPWQLVPYLGLALCTILLAAVYTRTFYFVTKLFRRARWPACLRPAVGVFLAGVVTLVLYASTGDVQVLSVLSFGYNSLQNAITNETTVGVGLLVAIAFGKILTTSFTIGSGGSGGVFGPSMVIGGCGGGAFGVVMHRFWPNLVPHPASFVIVGMAGFFAAAAKTPFSTIVIVSEMTGGYHLLLPALWVCVVAFIFSDEQSLYANQLETRQRSPAHRGAFVRALMGPSTVGDHLKGIESIPLLSPGDSLDVVIERMTSSRYDLLPVVDDAGRFLGIVSLDDVLVLSQEPAALFIAADLMRTDVTPLTPNERVDVAVQCFVEHDVLALPVVDDTRSGELVGLVKRFDVSTAYLRSIHGPDARTADRSKK